MLSLLIRKEILDQLLSLRFSISCIVCFVVILSSVFVLTKDYKEDMLDYRTNMVMHRNQVLGYDNIGDMWQNGINVDKPLNVMKIFFRGISQQNGATARITATQAPEFQRGDEGNPVIPLFPTIDLVFFIGVIMSLLAIAFSYDAISGEKENGTLKLMMSYSVPRDTVLLSKWIGGYIVLIAPFALSILCGLVIVTVFPEAHLTAEHWLGLVLILGLALFYISAIYSLGIFVSTRTHMASTSITVLLLIWVILTLIIPNLSPYVASQIQPASSIQAVEREKAGIEQDISRKREEEFGKWVQEAQKNNVPFEKIIEKWKTMQQESQAKIDQAHRKVEEHFKRGLDAQIVLAKNLSKASPLSPFVYSVADISDTGVKERDHFLKTLSLYKDKWTQYVYSKITVGSVQGGGEQFDTSDYPKFIYEESPLNDRIKGIFTDLLILAVWNILFFMGAYLSFLRYDVR